MTLYSSLPILEELICRVEDDTDHHGNWIKAIADGILAYHFTAVNGFVTVAPAQPQNEDYADFIIRRIQRHSLGDRGLVDHAVAGATKKGSSDASLHQLEKALGQSNTESGRCWALMIHGTRFSFYEYHLSLPPNHRLIPWGPSSQPARNSFHVRHDAAIIDLMLQRMAQDKAPPARQCQSR